MNPGEQPPRRNKREIFLGALEQPTPEARAAYLDGACGGDPALRAAVEALLKNLQQDSFLESSAVDTPQLAAAGASRGGTAILGAGAEKPGDMVGRYKLMEKIGEGGFGAVYVAEQREPVKRHVALKIIKPGMDTRQVVARFEAERQALAMMEHLSIAKVLDAGAMPSGRPYFVMELVRGIKITEYCDQHKLSTEDRLGLFAQTCLATEHAHQRGIIHRDIKPSNILVTMYDGVPVPKVIDFGIAKATQGELTDKTIYTELQMFMGTPVYMSPEQAEMSGLPIDTRSDIYSLGVLLYELLTGRTPFDHKELMGAGVDEMRRIIREKEPARPSTCLGNLPENEQTTTAARHRTDAPKLMLSLRGDLDWIVMKCLEKDRTRRYDTAASLAADVQRYLRNELVLARPPSLAYRVQKLVRRNKSTLKIVGAVLAGVLMGLLLAGWLAFRVSRAASKSATVPVDPTINMNGRP
jgi:eukaryotic-like serine/threonine-protein kinase